MLMGGTDKDVGTRTAVDSKGNVYAIGYFKGVANFGGGDMTSKGDSDVFLTSFSATGVHRWQIALGGTGFEHGYGVAVDAADNVYITGGFYNTVDLGGGSVTSQGDYDVFIVSYTSHGVHRWQKVLGSTEIAVGHNIAVDESSNIYITGHFLGTANLGGGNITAQSSDAFVTSFTSAGVHRWQKALGGSGYDVGYGVAVDKSSNVYVAGTFEGRADLGGGSVTSKGDLDIFVVSYSSTGAHRWQRANGGPFFDRCLSAAADENGNVYVTGYFEGATTDLGGGSLTSRGSRGLADAFITSFSSIGTHRWQKTLGGIYSDKGTAVAVDGSGNIYVSGDFQHLAFLGGDDVFSKGSIDIFVTSYSSIGVHRWQKALGGTDTDYTHGVAVDLTGNIYVTGSFDQTTDLGMGSITGKGDFDAFLVKLTP
ncbi:MAG: SBBP repeat-containing protein [Deltaproteobacteria bacterium]|nr:SBBP repeat-containing protein [Deltaproteobacteria bacterium]